MAQRWHSPPRVLAAVAPSVSSVELSRAHLATLNRHAAGSKQLLQVTAVSLAAARRASDASMLSPRAQGLSPRTVLMRQQHGPGAAASGAPAGIIPPDSGAQGKATRAFSPVLC